MLVAVLFGALATALVKSPSSIDELVGWVYPEGSTSEFVPIKSPAQVAVADVKKSLLQLSSLGISPYPLKAGQVSFDYLNTILESIPEGTVMKIYAYVDGQSYHQGDIDLCPYLPFAKLECPLGPSPQQLNETKLLVPANGYNNRFAFVVEARAPNNDLVLHMAAILDCVEGHDEL